MNITKSLTQKAREKASVIIQQLKNHAEVNKYRIWLFLGIAVLLPFIDNAVAKLLGTNISQERIAMVILFLVFPILHIRSRIAILLAILTTLTLPFLLIARKVDSAEQLAIYTYYFLVVGFIWTLVETASVKYKEKLIG